MCGIIGYLGERSAAPIIMESLKRLEYRGYDSAGVAIFNEADGQTSVVKSAAKVDTLVDARPSHGHQRAPSHRLSQTDHGDPQRHHRELRRAAEGPAGEGPRIHLRDGHRGGAAPDRGVRQG